MGTECSDKMLKDQRTPEKSDEEWGWFKDLDWEWGREFWKSVTQDKILRDWSLQEGQTRETIKRRSLGRGQCCPEKRRKVSGPGEGQGLRSWSEKWAELTGKWAGAEGGQGLGQWGLASGRCLWWMTGEWGGW